VGGRGKTSTVYENCDPWSHLIIHATRLRVPSSSFPVQSPSLLNLRSLVFAGTNQDKRRNLLGFFGGKKNNQAAQAIDQSKFPFGGGINQGQAGELINRLPQNGRVEGKST
jgi:hypothetical protein